MALSTVLDLTVAFNASGTYSADISGWDWITVQLVTPTGAVNFLGSNDSGAATGTTDGNALTSVNFTNVQAINLATGTGSTSGNTSGMWRFPVISRYLQLSGGAPVTKILVYLSKIS